MIGVGIDLVQPRGGFSPLQLPSLAGWWDASDNGSLAELADGLVRGVATNGVVGFMQDLSGNGRHMTATTKPTLDSANFLTFGASAFMTVSNFPYTYPVTAFVVMLNHSGVGTQYVFGGNATTGQNLGFSLQRTSATAGRVQALDYTNPGLPSTRSLNFPASSISSGGKSVLGMRVTAAQLANYNNALTETTTTTTCVAGGVSTNLNLGSSTGAGANLFTNGKIGEAIVCLSSLTLPQITQIMTYLKLKWGVT